MNDLIPKGWGLFDKYIKLSNYVSTIEELEDIFLNPDKYRSSEDSRKKVLKDYTFNLNGNTSEIVINEMKSIINK